MIFIVGKGGWANTHFCEWRMYIYVCDICNPICTYEIDRMVTADFAVILINNKYDTM
jgi:hypothetical protein